MGLTSRRSVLSGIAASGLLTSWDGLRAAVTGRGRSLQQRVTGEVLERADHAYEAARSAIWCANVPPRYPAMILRAASVEDVVEAVRFAKAHHLRVAVRGGGHNWSAASLRDDALMVDLGGLTAMRVDPVNGTAQFQPGVSGGALFTAVEQAGYVFPIAHCPSVPMSGFLLNGGYGFNAGDWGPSALLIDAMEIVTASGERVVANASTNADMFWAARGAGPGFFGIVTRFDVRLLKPKNHILATNYIFPLSATQEATSALQKIRSNCPNNVELTFLASAGMGPPGAPSIGIVSGIAFADDERLARKSLDFLDDFPAKGAAMVVQNRVAMSWHDLFEAVAGLFPPKMSYLGNTIWTSAPVEQMYTPYAAHLANAPTPHAFSNCVCYPPGFAQRTQEYGAALSRQDDTLCLQYAIWDDASLAKQNEDWFHRSIAIFQPHAKGHYIGETDLNLYPQFAAGAYSAEAWQKISKLRQARDPARLFFDYLGHDRGRT